MYGRETACAANSSRKLHAEEVGLRTGQTKASMYVIILACTVVCTKVHVCLRVYIDVDPMNEYSHV